MRARALVAIVGTVLGVGGTTLAGAADLPRAPVGDFRLQHSERGLRAGVRTIYDDQPGVVVRAYWREPWRHRHYYPSTGNRPAVGRDEDLSTKGAPPRPAESYARNWSASSVFMPELPDGRDRDIEAEPPLK